MSLETEITDAWTALMPRTDELQVFLDKFTTFSCVRSTNFPFCSECC
jgi:hypothetical protein